MSWRQGRFAASRTLRANTSPSVSMARQTSVWHSSKLKRRVISGIAAQRAKRASAALFHASSALCACGRMPSPVE